MGPPSWECALLLVTKTRGGRQAALTTATIRLASGAIFVAFGLAKFTNHAGETSSFAKYGLPHPAAFVLVIGAAEVVFGILLVTGLGTRIAALVLAGDMVGAISTAGRVEGGTLNLGLAPTLLVAMLIIVWLGAGAGSLDRHFERRLLG